MLSPIKDIDKQVEAAYDFRGYVTLKFKSGETVEGFVFNREFDNPLMKEDNFIEVFLKGGTEKRQYPISTLQSIELTGEDYAVPFTPPPKN
ncbi:MAG: hypothetical protein A2901_00570 [Elusimicrobia bacterium RIFCSPLOWO2_01_FULL_54_10]|nr:MAG: hypothetical protein A2901_00570 [Elusimicrobia bacterium RIFCSPLOWO2_01_FULL_54_10]